MEQGEVGVFHHVQNVNKTINLDLLFLIIIPHDAPILHRRQRPLDLLIPLKGSSYQLVPCRTVVLEKVEGAPDPGLGKADSGGGIQEEEQVFLTDFPAVFLSHLYV